MSLIDDLDDDDDGMDLLGEAGDGGLTHHEVRQQLLTGLTARDFANMFHIDDAEVLRRISVAGIKQCGMRRNRPIWLIADVAPYLVKPVFDVEAYIKKLKPRDLPPALQKGFWDAQKARQNYEEEAGNLWHTHRVQRVVGEILMMTRQRLVLGTDTIDRMLPLTPEQRAAVQTVFDRTLGDLQAKVIEHFKDYDGAGDRQDMFENGPPKPYRDENEDEDDDGLGL